MSPLMPMHQDPLLVPGVTELTSKAHESEELKLSKPPAANLQETRGILGGLVTQEEREMLTCRDLVTPWASYQIR